MSQNDSNNETKLGVYWVSGILVLFAVIFLFQPLSFTSPATAPVKIPSWVTSTTPVRQPTLEPLYRAGVFTYRCSQCHDIIPSPLETRRMLTQHTEIQLKHGMNNRCFNCHHRTNRDAFADDQGNEIPWNRPEILCGKCHGPVYRDWQHGVHGRSNGYWLARKGPQQRRKCIECHDPHQPPFPPMHPAPGPHTLRMGPQDSVDHTGDRDPLRVLRSQYKWSADGVKEGN